MLASLGGSEGISPSYVERGRDSWRAFFEWFPQGDATISYVLRLNGAGRFSLPATRVEAMYTPDIFAMVPNGAMTVTTK